MEAVVGDAAAEGAFQVAALVGQFQDVQVLAADQVAAVVEQQQRQQLFQVFLTRVPSCVPTFSLSLFFFCGQKEEIVPTRAARPRATPAAAASGIRPPAAARRASRCVPFQALPATGNRKKKSSA